MKATKFYYTRIALVDNKVTKVPKFVDISTQNTTQLFVIIIIMYP